MDYESIWGSFATVEVWACAKEIIQVSQGMVAVAVQDVNNLLGNPTKGWRRCMETEKEFGVTIPRKYSELDPWTHEPLGATHVAVSCGHRYHIMGPTTTSLNNGPSGAKLGASTHPQSAGTWPSLMPWYSQKGATWTWFLQSRTHLMVKVVKGNQGAGLWKYVQVESKYICAKEIWIIVDSHSSRMIMGLLLVNYFSILLLLGHCIG